MKKFSKLMEDMNLQIKHLGQCLAFGGYLVNVSSLLIWWWRTSSLHLLPESIECASTLLEWLQTL